MKTVILAGGFGTRISEESEYRPKPMIEIGGKPILWHIMKIYSAYGFYDFVICAGYKQHVIKDYFSRYAVYNSDITFEYQSSNKLLVHANFSEPWKVTVVDTGLNTLTGGRVKRIAPYIDDDIFMLTYGDAVCDVNIGELVEFHRKQGNIATVTAVKPKSRYGFLGIEKSKVTTFREKSDDDVGYINGGFMVLRTKIFDYIKKDGPLEREPLENVVADGEMNAFCHRGYWQCMDTLRDKRELETAWESGKAPWKVWKD